MNPLYVNAFHQNNHHACRSACLTSTSVLIRPKRVPLLLCHTFLCHGGADEQIYILVQLVLANFARVVHKLRNHFFLDPCFQEYEMQWKCYMHYTIKVSTPKSKISTICVKNGSLRLNTIWETLYFSGRYDRSLKYQFFKKWNNEGTIHLKIAIGYHFSSIILVNQDKMGLTS